ncbi:VanZ family protein [Demequina sp. NBRC 110057]|uniref:VanZ family protein n=1 Tax=Demequina sp. NBRC 110057 TaxID=1570346 RepID=UPI000A027677|nr:VanZ family protein [Demequina sp. NBRC 110057]
MPTFTIDGVNMSFPIVLIAIGAVVTAIAFARGGRGRRVALWGGLVLSLALIGMLTLASLVGDDFDGAQGVNLVPFQEIERGWGNRGSTAWTNLVGNVLLFIPFGAAVAGITYGGPLRRVLFGTVLGGLLSTGIELTQYWGGRVADIDDIILNTAGAFLGALLAATIAGIATVGSRKGPA